MNLLKEDKVVEKAVGVSPGRLSTRIEREERDYQGKNKWASSLKQKKHNLKNVSSCANFLWSAVTIKVWGGCGVNF